MPRVLGIDDFALRRGSVHAIVLIDAQTGRRIDVVAGRTADVAENWLRDHPGVEVSSWPIPAGNPARGCRLHPC